MDAIVTAYRRNRVEGGTYFFAVDLAERAIWQRRFCEHTIRDEQDYAAHVDYIHLNPVRHRLVGDAAAWPYSSFRRAVAMGMYPAGWVGSPEDLGDVGERL